ncbi:TMV resistance N-like [Olea europaea subsp. europaea]|uniref:TMV resistance N-like n=1 Tax=Olea europaea subsp. europaea TaxID=158383 RepID=A0A8S0ULD5_OLEEU|nr:TMV resistance N-like [Olea europaea subsp. europaea]
MKLLQLQIRNLNSRKHRVIRTPFDVFINYGGKDTRRTIASLLFDHLYRLNFRPFLDDKSMKPGDKLFDKIDNAIKWCKIGVPIFSPRCCESYFCLHELALILESKKKMIPIFCDVKPSELHVLNNGRIPLEEVEKFNLALEEDVVTNAAKIVVESLIEEEQMLYHNPQIAF